MEKLIGYLLGIACLVGIAGGSVYLYKNVDYGCITVPFTGKACGIAVGK